MPETLVGEEVVVVDPVPLDDVVLPTVEVVVDVGEVVSVDDDVEVVVVVVVVGGGDVVAGVSKIFSTVVPPPAWPKRSAKGRPAMSSTTVTNRRETTKTTTTTPTVCGHGSVVREVTRGTDRGVCRSLVSTVPSALAVAAALVAGSSCTADPGDGPELVTPEVFVPPSRRTKALSGTRTTTCLTALLVRSIDWKTRAVPVVAAMEPIATPTMVPLTPKMEAMTADSTAPAAEAAI